VEITNDRPSRRSFVMTDGNLGGSGPDSGALIVRVQWDEVGDQVGSHDTFAAAPSTIEQLFAECQGRLDAAPAASTISFMTDEHGVPTACGYTPTNCVGDCFFGFHTTAFGCGVLDAATGAP
jgi:hypothetical protein